MAEPVGAADGRRRYGAAEPVETTDGMLARGHG